MSSCDKSGEMIRAVRDHSARSYLDRRLPPLRARRVSCHITLHVSRSALRAMGGTSPQRVHLSQRGPSMHGFEHIEIILAYSR